MTVSTRLRSRRLTTSATLLAVAGSLLVASPAAADPADYHLTWFNTAEGSTSGTYQGVINAISTTDVGTDGLNEVTVPSGQVLESDCSAPVPAGAQALCWTAGDDKAEEWIPQGLTTSNDGNAGSVSKIFVTWYDGCSTGTRGSDWGLDNQGCQDGPNSDEAEDKGARVSIYTPGVGYRNVLLVEPFYNSSGNPSFHATHMHAGGIALYGNFLYVADTKHGLRVFDTRQILDMNESLNANRPTDITDKTQVGRHNNKWYSFGYRWVWPAVGEWRLDDAVEDGTHCLGVGNKLKFSYLGVDRSLGYLVAGEYCPADPNNEYPAGRIARWQLGSQTVASSGIADGWAKDAVNLPKLDGVTDLDHVQGAVTRGNTYYVNASDGHDRPGKLWRFQLVGTTLTNGVNTPAAKGCEDLSYDTTTGNLYSLSEYYDARAIYRMPF